MAGSAENPLNHVIDHDTIELPWFSGPTFDLEIHLPRIMGIQITRFMVMELVVAALLIAILIPGAVPHRARRRSCSRGWFMNMFEAVLLFIRDEVARPSIGGHAADQFLPYLWTAFFFVLFSNLLGMIPGAASTTGNVNVTGVLALMTFAIVVRPDTASRVSAASGWALVPHLDVPKLLKPFCGA